MTSDKHRQAADAALVEACRNPVLSPEQWFRAAQVNALLAIEARLAQIADRYVDHSDPSYEDARIPA